MERSEIKWARPRSVSRRRMSLVGAAFLGAVVLLFASYLILLVASPYAREPVPTG